ncbi:FAA hydrolase family protein [Alginatibacterium sediminis]|uniref:FAA hydrolase family protein n=1 Tax=Alginatibacterium sediminis TaxID=2164068 RepID=A0A420EHS7_9ALTE|nr:fumarylacetoacetate hydrolase family protein [Alginatibacterium sediminis]RKF20243.1 FAA hydrolase family protein [Alginatibacterium sediminis]
MKLASLKSGRDGRLIVVSRDLSRAVEVSNIAHTMQQALDNWQQTEPRLQNIYQQLNEQQSLGFEFDQQACHSPLPRAYHWADGSAYVNHVELVRKARGAQMPDSFWHDPLIYQGGSDTFLAPTQDIQIPELDWGVDFEAEIAIIVDDVMLGCSTKDAGQHIKLICLVNDVSLRNLIPGELAKGFGFYQSKPSSAFSPVAVTPDELHTHWQDSKVHLPLSVHFNNELYGQPNAGVDMTFDFSQLLSHAAKSRPLAAGTIIGSGTVSNKDRSVGSCCIAEQRMLETIEHGKPISSFMRYGDNIRIEMFDHQQNSIFGQINQNLHPVE